MLPAFRYWRASRVSLPSLACTPHNTKVDDVHQTSPCSNISCIHPSSLAAFCVFLPLLEQTAIGRQGKLLEANCDCFEPQSCTCTCMSQARMYHASVTSTHVSDLIARTLGFKSKNCKSHKHTNTSDRIILRHFHQLLILKFKP